MIPKSKIYKGYVLAIITYAFFSLVLPPDPATLLHYHLTTVTYRELESTLIVLLGLIWFVAFFGSDKLLTYSRRIRTAKDGKYVLWMARGALLLAVSLPVTTIVGSLLRYWAQRYPGFADATTIISNYLGILFPLVAYIMISTGVRGLSELAKLRPSQRATYILGGLLIVVGVLYSYLVTTAAQKYDSLYHMPVGFVLGTLVVPYLFMWFIGLLATFEIYIYHRKAAGVVYRTSWQLLALGFGWVILTSVVFQYLTTLYVQLNDLSLFWLLMLVYGLLGFMSIGYILIALGSKRLQKIEEV